MKIKRATRAFLREAWHGPLTIAKIARRARISERAIREFWVSLKQLGALPDSPRPHFAQNTTPLPQRAIPFDDVDDDEVETAPAPANACDVLLQVHAPFCAPPLNSVSRKFLVLESRRPHEGPTPAELAEAAREYDRMTREFA